MDELKLQTSVRARREASGLTQEGLAESVGVSRQALSAIEAGRQVPSTALALRLAQRLGCPVEDLFWFEADAAELSLEVELAPAPPRPWTAGRVALGRVGERWVAHPLADEDTSAADGLLQPSPTAARGDATRARVTPTTEPRLLADTVLIAGCAPLLGLLSDHTRRRNQDVHTTWLPHGSGQAVQLLEAGRVHVAGVHSHAGPGALPVALARTCSLVNLTRWRQGLVVAPGNPLGLRDAADLCRADVRVVAREPGSGAQALLEALLDRHGVPRPRPGRRAAGSARATRSPLTRWPVARSHGEVASWVQCGAADVGVVVEAVALARGLDFVPLSEESFDLIVPHAWARDPRVLRALDVLTTRGFRAEAERLPGYDLSSLGAMRECAA